MAALIDGIVLLGSIAQVCRAHGQYVNGLLELSPTITIWAVVVTLSVDGLQEPKAQVARAAHTLSVCKRHLAHELPLFNFILLFTTTIDLRLIGTSPDEDLISYVHVAYGLEVSSQTNTPRLNRELRKVY
jgi:hypothetical protein